jgi:hypothetical protein
VETEATVQDVETTEAPASNDDIFGDSPNSTVEAEPEQDPGEETPSGEAEAEEEGGAETTEDTEASPDEDEEVEIELPTQQSKTYSDDLRNEYARRFGWTLDELAQDKSKAFAVKKAIDSDIYLNQLQSKLDSLTETESVEEEESDPAATEAAGNEQREQYDRFISQASEQFISPAHVEKYGRNFAIAMLGTDPEKITDPKQKAEAEAFVKRGSAMAKAFLPGLLDLVETYVPRRMEAYLDAAMPGFSEQRAVQETSSVWEQLRKSSPEFASFPAYGARDGDYGKFIAENAAKIPNFDKIKFEGLSRREATAAKLQLIAQVASGKRATPQVVRQAAETAKKQVEDQQARKQAAKALGAGNSKSQLTPPKTGNDDIFGAPGEVQISQRLTSKSDRR